MLCVLDPRSLGVCIRIDSAGVFESKPSGPQALHTRIHTDLVQGISGKILVSASGNSSQCSGMISGA